MAIYGAVVATAVAVWNIYREVTDRGRLRVQVVKMNAVQGGVIIATVKLWVNVTNVGRRPIWLSSIGGRNRRGSPTKRFKLFPTQPLPVKLEPGEEFNDYSADVSSLDPKKVRYLSVWDSIGRVHKAPRRQFRELFED